MQIYPATTGMTSVAQQYLQALVRASSSMKCLVAIGNRSLADRLIAHFLPGLFFPACQPGSVYWVDAETSSASDASGATACTVFAVIAFSFPEQCLMH